MQQKKKNWIIAGIIGLIFIFLLWLVEGILLPFIAALLLAYFLDPAVDKLQRYKLSRTVSTTGVVGLFIFVVVSLFLILLPILQTQLAAFMVKIPTYASVIWSKIKALISFSQQSMSPDQIYNLQSAVNKTVFTTLNSVGDMLLNFLSGGIVVFNVLSLLLIIPVLLFYTLRDWDKITKEVMNLIPKKHETQTKSLLSDINQTLSGFIRGQASVCLVLAIFYAVGLSLTGIDLGVLIGLLTGILSFIPYFGFLTGVVLSVLLGLAQGAGWGVWIGLLIVFSLGQLLESYILTPKLVGDKVGLHPVWVIFALLAGGALFGFVGILVAVPFAAVIGVLLRRGVSYYKTTDFYKGRQ